MNKQTIITIVVVAGLVMFFWYLFAASFYDANMDKQKQFLTDGCTMFFEGNWSECCFVHDEKYFDGGSAEDRAQADSNFRKCVYKTTNNKILSQIMYGAVRIGGTPFLPLPCRWGFGWRFGRGYR